MNDLLSSADPEQTYQVHGR